MKLAVSFMLNEACWFIYTKLNLLYTLYDNNEHILKLGAEI